MDCNDCDQTLTCVLINIYILNDESNTVTKPFKSYNMEVTYYTLAVVYN